MATPLITQLRQSLWSAINHWPALHGVFQRQWTFEDANAFIGADIIPAFGDLPLIAITPAPSASPWALNQSKQITCQFVIEIWTPHWELGRAEQLWQEIVTALFQAKPTATAVPFTRANGVEILVNDFQVERALLDDGNRALKTTLPVGLRTFFNPTLATT